MELYEKELASKKDNYINPINKMPKLTKTEMEIASMVSAGLSTTEIALNTFKPVSKVKTHRKNISKKLGIDNSKVSLEFYLRSNLSRNVISQ